MRYEASYMLILIYASYCTARTYMRFLFMYIPVSIYRLLTADYL